MFFIMATTASSSISTDMFSFDCKMGVISPNTVFVCLLEQVVLFALGQQPLLSLFFVFSCLSHLRSL